MAAPSKLSLPQAARDDGWRSTRNPDLLLLLLVMCCCRRLCCFIRREVAELKARGHDEAWVPQSQVYQMLQRQMAELNAQLEARGKQLVAVSHERDELLRHFETKQATAEVGVAHA